MRNLRSPWHAGARWKAQGQQNPKQAWWQSALQAREAAVRLRRRAKRLKLLNRLDFLKGRLEERSRALDGVRTQLRRSIEDPASPISPYNIDDPGDTFDEPYDTSSVTDDATTSTDEAWSYDENGNGATNHNPAKKPSKAAKKRTTKKSSKRRK